VGGKTAMRAITSDFRDDELEIFIERDIDHHNAAEIRRDIDAEITRYRPKLTILNFDAVEFMDSSGIGLIMGRYKLMESAGGGLKVTALNHQCQKLVDLSGITQLVSFV
jgi:stage II sporulation protein AA (anti-sigma F factor antagonist)